MSSVHLSTEQLAAMTEIGQLAGELGAPATRAAAVLDSMLRLTGADCALLSAWDPVTLRHRALANAGYDAATVAYLTGPRFQADDGFRFIRALRRPTRQCDVDRPERREPLRTLRAAGFREGLTHCLHSADGRYVGMLKLSTAAPEPLADDTVLTLDLLTASLSVLTDLTRETQLAASLLPPQMPLVLARADGTTAPVPGRPTSPLLAAGSEAVDESRRRARSSSPARFLLRGARDDELWQVVAIRLRGELLVGLQRARPPLTLRELEVATLIATGATNAEIAQRLVIARSTVNRHLEHLMEKLGVRSRAAVAARVVQDGLQLAPIAEPRRLRAA